jgi:hypothetical protein
LRASGRACGDRGHRQRPCMSAAMTPTRNKDPFLTRQEGRQKEEAAAAAALALRCVALGATNLRYLWARLPLLRCKLAHDSSRPVDFPSLRHRPRKTEPEPWNS